MSGLAGLSADARSKTIGQNFRVRAWVNFKGDGTVAIRSSGNGSSITDNGTGNYTVNFTTAMEDGNYVVTTNQPPFTYTSGNRQHFIHVEGTSTYSASSVDLKTGSVAQGDGAGTAYDFPVMTIAIFR